LPFDPAHTNRVKGFSHGFINVQASPLKNTTPTSAKRRPWYKVWRDIHLYLGLTIGAVFVLAGLTGSLLVFYVELDEVLNPELHVTEQQTQQPLQSYEAIYQALKQAHSERSGAWRLEIPRNSQAMLMARYYKAKEKEHVHFAPLMAWVNPYTGEVVSSRFWGDYVMTWIYDLHYELLLDKTGKIIMGIIGIFLLVSVVIGVYLWWPKSGKFKSALTFKAKASKERFHYDLHNVSGIYSLVFLGLLLISGAILELPDYFNPLLNKLSPLHKGDDFQSTVPHTGQTRITVDEAVKLAAQNYPNAKLRWIETPSNAEDSYNFRFYQKGEPSQRFPKSIVWVDQYNGKVLAKRDPAEQSSGDVFLSWMHPLHSGEIAGMTGRVIVVISGFIPAILFYTGFVRWRQKCKAKQRKQLANTITK
jgi:uncharacterized iron-regulated membrane protein